MPPQGSKKVAGVRRSKLLEKSHIIEEPDSEITLPVKNTRKKYGRKPKQKTKSQKFAKASVEEDFDNQDGPSTGLRLQRGSAHNRKVAPAELFNLLERIAIALSAIGGPEDVTEYLENGGFGSNEAVQTIQRHCNTISNLLQQSATSQMLSGGQVPSTVAEYHKYFVYRGPSNLLYFLKPIEVLKGNALYHRRKVPGFVQEKGSSLPLMFALPGWKKCTDDHPRLLDSEFWTLEVKRWASFHNHRFRKFVFDERHGEKPGHTYSSHSEPRLMLWFACNLYGALTGVAESIRTQIGELWRLKDMCKGIEAEIVLTEEPCKPCLQFQALVESYTGIKFTVIVCPNLGRLKSTKNKQKFKNYPLYAYDSEEEEESPVDEAEEEVAEESPPDGEDDDDDEEQLEVMEETRSRIAVVIRGKPATTPSSSAPSRKDTKTSFAEYAASMMMTSTQKQQTLVRSKPKKPSKRYSHYDDSDEAEYLPPTAPKSKTTTHMSTPAKRASQNGIWTPLDSIPFGFDALQHTAKINKKKRKRQHDLDGPPTPTKKSHHIRF